MCAGEGAVGAAPDGKSLWKGARDRVRVPWSSPEGGGKLHLKLNTGERPIANKYREGKMKRPLERE
eukprot:ctg_1656.g506